ncbi:MAG TPA: VIT domain-containing protein [Candidatus Polarisedimenticolia bacterium]|jgi:Ca-activated chloride channel family protein
MSRTALASLAAVLLAVITASWGDAPEEAPGQGTLRAQAGGKLVEMPLRHTEVRAEISGFVARVEVTQLFDNAFKEPIEAVYVFPLPERAAVDDFVMEIGERRIRGEIKRREDARRTYEMARAAGYTAALLQQERPNIFTQSVANIAPGAQVRVRLRYVEILSYAEGSYRFLFPMVVGPRYTPAGRAAPDQPPVLRPGLRSGHDISVTVDLDAGVPIRALASDSHRIDVARKGGSRATIRLAPGDTLPNKDFMLRCDVAGTIPEVGVLAHRVDDDGFFALLVQPKAGISAAEATPKEIIFVLDESGSMSGVPIEMSKRFMRLALESLAPRDRFNIVRFAGSAVVLAPAPLDNTAANVKLGLEAVEGMRGGGGTQMMAGFRAAMAQPRDPRCIRIIIFLTDGFIGNEEEIFDLIRSGRGDARIFSLGIGSSVNHYLLREMADLGHGAYQYIRPDGREAEAVQRFQEWVTRPYLTDLEIDWGSLRVEDPQPARLPDLYSGQTLSLVGRYLWGGEDTVMIRGRLGGVPWEKQVRVNLPERAEGHASLASVWARERIRDLTLHPGDAAPAAIQAEVTSLALGFRLMSPFTSFVAVDESRVVNPGGNPVRVEQAVPIPELVSFEGVFGSGGPAGIHRPAEETTAPALEADFIQEVEVITSETSAEYGRADGGFAGTDLKTRSGVLGGVPGGVVQSARDTSLLAHSVPMTVARFDPAGVSRGRSPETGQRLEEASLRILADLADDGRLSRTEGLPALAGLVAAQGPAGRFSDTVRTQALAAWALAEAAAAEPRLHWVPEAARAAASYLESLRPAPGAWPSGRAERLELIRRTAAPAPSAVRRLVERILRPRA